MVSKIKIFGFLSGFLLIFFPVFSQAAISFSSAEAPAFQASGSTFTFSHTIASATDFLWVDAWGGSNTSGDVLSSITFDGVAMTRAGASSPVNSGDRWDYAYYLASPHAGTHDVIITWSSSAYPNGGAASSYACGSGCLFGEATSSDEGSGTNFTLNLTTTHDNSWGFISIKSFNIAAATGTTIRALESSTRNAIGDTNGPITPAGTFSMSFTTDGGENTVLASFYEATSVATSSLPSGGGPLALTPLAFILLVAVICLLFVLILWIPQSVVGALKKLNLYRVRKFFK